MGGSFCVLIPPKLSTVLWDWGSLSMREQTGAGGWQNSAPCPRSDSSLPDKAWRELCWLPGKALQLQTRVLYPRAPLSLHWQGAAPSAWGCSLRSHRAVFNWVCSVTCPIKSSVSSSWLYFRLLMVFQPCGWALSCCLHEEKSR